MTLPQTAVSSVCLHIAVRLRQQDDHAISCKSIKTGLRSLPLCRFRRQMFLSPSNGQVPLNPCCLGDGRARHSVRAVVANPNAWVGKRRRAEDCPLRSRLRCGWCRRFPNLLCRRLLSRQGPIFADAWEKAARCGFGNPRHSRLGGLRHTLWGASLRPRRRGKSERVGWQAAAGKGLPALPVLAFYLCSFVKICGKNRFPPAPELVGLPHTNVL